MQGKNAVNPVGLTSILTQAKAKILPLKSGSYDSRLLRLTEFEPVNAYKCCFLIYNIQSVDLRVVAFAKKIVKSCELLCEMMGEFENFKRSKKIQSLIISLNDVEEECDSLYLTSMRALTKNPADVYTAISMCKIYDCFESCADACEHASECVDIVVMKNT